MTRRTFQSSLLAAAQLPAPNVIDAHSHFTYGQPEWSEEDRKLIDAADKLGIHQLCCSIIPPQHPATLETFQRANRWVARTMQKFPGRILGYCFVNPGYGRAALDEVRRYIEEHRFIGIKLYNDYRVTDPVVAPVLELAGSLGVPVLQHAGHTSWLPSPQPNISDASHIAQAARLFPNTTFICAHICGGGDWEWSIKALRDAPPNVFLDTSGSVADEGVIEFAVRTLTADRLLFATDLSMTISMGRIRGAAISDADKAKLLGGNMARILARRKA